MKDKKKSAGNVSKRSAAGSGPLDLSKLAVVERSASDGHVQVVDDSTLIRLLEEDFVVDRRRVETGRVRVTRVTHQDVRTIDELLQHEHAEIERVPVGKIVDARPAIRETEEMVVIPIVEEVLVVERRLMLKEEVHIRKLRTSERHQQQIPLRRQDIEIVRTPAVSPETAAPEK